MNKRACCVVVGSALAILGLALSPQVSNAAPRAGLALVAPVSASPETRAWSVAKGSLPAGLSALLGINGVQLRSSQLFARLYPMLLAKNDVREGMELVKSQCNVDPAQAIDSLVFGMQGRDKGVFVLGLNGLDQAGVTSCLTKIAAADKNRPQKISFKQQGNIVEYTASGEKQKVYVAWLAKDVMAVTTDPSDKALLKKLTSGGLKGDAIGKIASGLKTDSALWAVTTKSQSFPELAQAKVSKAWASANFQNGNVEANAHAVVGSAEQASSAANGLLSRLDELKQSPLAGGLLKNVKVSSSGPEIIANAVVSESDLLALSSMVLGGMR